MQVPHSIIQVQEINPCEEELQSSETITSILTAFEDEIMIIDASFRCDGNIYS